MRRGAQRNAGANVKPHTSKNARSFSHCNHYVVRLYDDELFSLGRVLSCLNSIGGKGECMSFDGGSQSCTICIDAAAAAAQRSCKILRFSDRDTKDTLEYIHLFTQQIMMTYIEMQVTDSMRHEENINTV